MARAKLSNNKKIVYFDVLRSESLSRQSIITSKTVENGANVSDHVQNEILSISISALMTKDAPINYKNIVQFYKDNDILLYVGRNGVSSVVIESLNTEHPRDNQGGFNFTMTLKRIKFTNAKQVEILVPQFTNLKHKGRISSDTTNTIQQEQDSNLDSDLENSAKDEQKSSSALDDINQFLSFRGF